MKKIFLPLLALVGMVAGFTLCSCGGGGSGKNEGPARALTGMMLQLGSSPWIVYDFHEAVSSHGVSVTVRAGGGWQENTNSNTDTLTAQYNIENWWREGNTWKIRGVVSFASVVEQMQNSPEFLAYINVPTEATSVTLDRFVVQFELPVSGNSNTTGSTGYSYTVVQNGEYWLEGQTDGKKVLDKQKEATVTVKGALKTEYLETEGDNQAEDTLWPNE